MGGGVVGATVGTVPLERGGEELVLGTSAVHASVPRATPSAPAIISNLAAEFT